MKTVFVAVILIFDVETSLPLEMAVAAFDSPEACEASVAQVTARAADDLRVMVEGRCIESPFLTAS